MFYRQKLSFHVGEHVFDISKTDITNLCGIQSRREQDNQTAPETFARVDHRGKRSSLGEL
jgi:hypothetical protein